MKPINKNTNNSKPYDTRLYRIIYILNKLRNGKSIIYQDELCKKFGVTPRVLKKDVDLLFDLDLLVLENEEGQRKRKEKSYYIWLKD